MTDEPNNLNRKRLTAAFSKKDNGEKRETMERARKAD